MQREFQIEALANDGDEHVDRHRDPYLRLDRVLGGAEETLNAQVLLDPAKKQFYLPTAFVECADSERGQGEVVGEEDQRLGGFGILEANATQPLGVALMRVEHRQLDQLIADQPSGAIHGPRDQASELGIGLRPRDEEAAGLMHCVKALEVQIPAVHHVEGARLGHQQIEDVDIVELAVADMDEGGNSATQIEQRVQFHRRLGLAKRCPRKQRQTKVDGGRVQRVNRLAQFDAEWFLGIQAPGGANQSLGELEVDLPVASFVGVGKRTATDIATNTQVIQLGRLRAQAGFDVAQAFPVGKLGESHAQELIETAEAAHVEIALILRDQSAKGMPRCVLHDLREHELASVHRYLPGESGKTAQDRALNSSR